MTVMGWLLVVIRLALRDLRGAPGALLILVAGIGLGVAAVAAGGSVAGAALDATRGQARLAVGGDLSFRLFHRDFSTAERSALDAGGRLSLTTEVRTRVRPVDGPGGVLAEVKGVDAAWPLVGAVSLSPPQASLTDALASGPEGPGAIADAALLDALGLRLGDRLRVGSATVTLRAVVEAEPDRTFRALSLGPRLIVGRAVLAEAGVAEPGQPVYHYARLALPQGADPQSVVRDLETAFPDAGWRVVDAADGVPGLERVIAIARALLVLIGLAVLVIGAVGAAGAVRAHVALRAPRLAVLRAVGATPLQAAAVALVQVLAAALVAAAAGVAVGALAAVACRPLLTEVGIEAGAPLLQPAALAGAALFGILAALLSAAAPVSRVAGTPPAAILGGAPRPEARPSWRVRLGVAVATATLAGLAAVVTGLPVMTAIFAVLVAAATLAARLGAAGLARLAGRLRVPGRPVLRLALGSLARPGGPTGPVVTALGLTLTVLVCIAALDANARRHLSATLPETTPGAVLLSVPPEAAAALVRDLAALPGMERARSIPFLHGRLLAVNGVPVAERPVPRDVAWVARGDRGLSWAAAPPPGTELTAGAWWTAAPGEAVQLSVDARVADRLGVGVGDTLTLSLQGAAVTGIIANLRRVDWARLDLDVPILLSPPAEPPPHSHVAALWGSPAALDAAEALVAERHPTVAPLRLAPVLERLAAFTTAAGAALTGASGVTVLAAFIVLAGAVAADQRRRVREAAVLSAIGARPRQVLAAGLLAHALLGVATAAVALPLGLLAAWAVLAAALPGTWETPLLGPVALAAAGIAVLAAVGHAVARRALRRPPAEVLRARA